MITTTLTSPAPVPPRPLTIHGGGNRSERRRDPPIPLTAELPPRLSASPLLIERARTPHATGTPASSLDTFGLDPFPPNAHGKPPTALSPWNPFLAQRRVMPQHRTVESTAERPQKHVIAAVAA